MDRIARANTVKWVMILLGALCLALAGANLSFGVFGTGFIAILVYATVLAPRMSLAIPRSKFAISFSDAAVFLAFLYYGGPAAILMAAIETLASCYYLRKQGVPMSRTTVLTNISINTISISVTYLFWLMVLERLLISGAAPGETQHLLSTLGAIALSQFAVASFLAAAVVRSSIDGTNLWQTWIRNCFSSSLTQMVGAGLAGIIFKVINYGDIVTGVIAFVTLSLAYLSYRQSIGKVGEAILQVEAAEQEKAETERDRRREAEKHAAQLALTLEKEERANEALRKSEKDLQHAALYDSLTDLPNRKHFGDMLARLIEDYRNDPASTFFVLFLDIRKFKNINDSLGHTFGDKILTVAAKRFVRMLNPSDMVARIGGDEFAVILKNVASTGKAQKVARRIFDSIAQPFSLGGNTISIRVNIGIAPCDTEYHTPEEILRDADIAMHYAKEDSGGVAIFTKELRTRFLERVTLENDLRNAAENGELSMHYQPLIDLQDGGIIGFEALLRWNHSELGMIPPNKFIPIAEESGLIIPITVWILKETTTQLARWQKISPAHKDLIVSVNISGKHLSNDDLFDDVENALAISRISAASLKLEVTESAMMENAEFTISVLNRLKNLGVQLSIDDFGTGYSSLSYLHRLPFDTLKIDRSFVYSVGESGENSEILQTIISLAKSLKKKVVAEGIETESQLSLLQNLDCDYGQGYLLARPMTKEAAERSLYENKTWLPTIILSESDQSADGSKQSLRIF
jgi:diguanylate cyclase (GGDEF)-like protein